MAQKKFNPFEKLFSTSKFCSRPFSPSTVSGDSLSNDLIASIKRLDYEYDDVQSPKLSSNHLFDKNNREHFLISCNDCVNYVDNCVSRRVHRSMDDGKRWDFDLYRRNLMTNRSIIRLRFCMIIQRIIKDLPNKEGNRHLKRSKKNDPYKNFLANSIGNQLAFLKRALRTCQTRQKVLATFRNAVLKVVWDFHIKNNEPWRYIMFYWKIIVDKELRISPNSNSVANEYGPKHNVEPFHSLITVAKTYVDSLSSKVDETENGTEFRVPVHWSDDEQEKFYKFYENYLSERGGESSMTFTDSFNEFRQKTLDAVKKYNKIQSSNEENVSDERKVGSANGLRNGPSQSFMKKRVQRMNLIPVSESINGGQNYSSQVVPKKPVIASSMKLQGKNSLAPPSILNSPSFERRKLSLPDVTKTSTSTSQTPRSRKKPVTNGLIQGKKWNQIQIFIPRVGRGNVAMSKGDVAQKLRKPTVTPNQLNDIVERLRRPLDRSVKSKALRQLLCKENANLAKKRFKPEREVLQIVERLSTLNERSSFDYSDHVDFEKSLRKYDLLNTMFRRKSNNTPYGSSHQVYVDHSDEDENPKLLKNRKSTKNPRMYGSNKSINDDADLITISEVRPRTQSQKLPV